MRCAEFYICLTTPIYFTRASPPPRQEERDANQTCWLDCDHDRIGWHRGCGGWILPPGTPQGGGSPPPPHPPPPPPRRSPVARRRIVAAETQTPAPPPLYPQSAPGGAAPPPPPLA